MITEPTLPLTIFCVVTLAGFIVYDRLVRRQYKVARDAWERDGKPPGFAWSPREASTIRSWTRSKAFFRLLTGTPDWLSHDARGRALQKQFRVLWFAAAGAWLWFALLLVMARASSHGP